MSDASEMLAAALEQMDGIIAGNHTEHLDFKGLSFKWAQHAMRSGHIWKWLAGKWTVTQCPLFASCTLIFSLKVLNKSESLAHSALLHEKIQKLSIVPASVETNDYSSSTTFAYKLVPESFWLCSACAAVDEQPRLQVQSPHFSADVCNYSTDLSNGSEVGDHMTPTSLCPIFSETTAIIKSHSFTIVRKP